MEHIDGNVIDRDLAARMKYMQSFLGWDAAKDGKLIEACKPVLAPIVTKVVDAVYDQLLKYDITAASFAPKQSQEGGATVDASVRDLHANHENIKFRKDFLKGYLVRLVSNHDWTPESKFWEYIDMVGKVHTGSTDSGLKSRKNRPALFVEYREINLLLGWVENAVTDIVMGVEGLELQTKVDILKAFNKFWWIQNDLFARHYIPSLRVPRIADLERMTWIDKLKYDPVFPIVSTLVLLVAIFTWKF
ncbi:uncharacterized protein Z520_11455 [Fonsecaea multimorphosa CBS 102226]|uniref:Globin-sensor domain-containing protein n=1 Tax=Fonsecaea multimorphosa CBS 102226 TaxID=1442371 RepID=A0A0D2JHX8_9EURO|nr:uncharacterized protein Z520_11455 [Fonsecaea multimorphosa CBS 102226]KIX92792.1 hypothetical protein Z520_11455 [Fonsecaea multimorphosa CBS 102226]OAL18040.1 hypothetical protein AYO22_11056 [Fonsecaea multimorphosa]